MQTTHNRFDILMEYLHEGLADLGIQPHQLWGALEEAEVVPQHTPVECIGYPQSSDFAIKSRSIIVAEHLPKNCLGLLLVRLHCWLQTYDEIIRHAYELDDPKATTTELDNGLLDVEINLETVDPVILQRDEAGRLELFMKKYEIV